MESKGVTDELTPKAVATLLRARATVLRAEIEGLGDAVCRWRPAEGEWCVNEVLGHLYEAERRGFNGRIRTIVAEQNPELQVWDQPAVARARRDHERNSIDLLREFATLREDSTRLVENLTPDQLDRAGRHPIVGELTVRDLLHEWVHHDGEHLKQILSNVQAYVRPHMGNARRFSEPD